MPTLAKAKPPSPFAIRLRELRESVPLTQSQAAKGVGVHVQTYMRWERGGTEPTFSELVRLAALFGVSLNAFAPADGDAG